MATIYPSRSRRRAFRIAETRNSILETRGSEVGNWECVSRSSTNGPHSGQAMGCAWKRLSNGSVYSAWQSSHMGKSAMVVLGRSYGMSLIMVKRGPQCVQLINGYRYRLSLGLKSSRSQSGQMAISAEMG